MIKQAWADHLPSKPATEDFLRRAGGRSSSGELLPAGAGEWRSISRDESPALVCGGAKREVCSMPAETPGEWLRTCDDRSCCALPRRLLRETRCPHSQYLSSSPTGFGTSCPDLRWMRTRRLARPIPRELITTWISVASQLQASPKPNSHRLAR